MKKIIGFILSLFLITSCITQQKCYQRFPPTISVKDSIVYRDSLIFLHDTIPFYIKADTVHDSIPYKIKNGKIKDISISKETPFAKAKAGLHKGLLYLDLMQKDSILNGIINDSVQVKLKTLYHSETIKPQVIIKWKTHWYDKVARKITGGELIILIIYLLIKLGPKILKLL